MSREMGKKEGDNMNIEYWLFAIGNIILFFGTCLLIKGVWKNKASLKDFSPLGSLLTFIPCSMFSVAYLYMHNWISFGFGLFTVLFWALAAFFSIKPKVITLMKSDPLFLHHKWD